MHPNHLTALLDRGGDDPVEVEIEWEWLRDEDPWVTGATTPEGERIALTTDEEARLVDTIAHLYDNCYEDRPEPRRAPSGFSPADGR
jgi:hypothetical protein